MVLQENILCAIASNKQIETLEFYNMNGNSIIDFTWRYNKHEVTLHCRRCDSDFACQDEFKLNSDELPLVIVLESYLYVEVEI